MKKILLTLLLSSCFVSSAQAQRYGVTSDDYYDDANQTYDTDDYYHERNRTRVIRERSKAVHEEESAKRDRIATRVYSADADRHDDYNSWSTVSQAARAVSDVANTAQYIKNLFGN